MDNRRLTILVWGGAGLLLATSAMAKTVRVDRPMVLVGDLFSNCAPVCDLVFADAPRPGQSKVWRRQEVKKQAAAIGLAVDGFKIMAPVRVRREGRLYSAKEIQQLVTQAVQAALPKGVSLVQVGRVQKMVLPENGLLVTTRFDEADRYARAVSLKISMTQQEVEVASLRVLCRLSYTATLPVATRTLGRDHILAPGDVEWKDMAVAGDPGEMTDQTSLVGMRVVHKIPQGTRIRARDLAVMPVVSRGDSMVLRCQVGGVRVLVRGVARQDGIPNKKIAVEVPSLHRMLFARVTGPGEGMVER